MLVYKYRGGSDDIFNRDLSAIENNYFWSSSIEQLNDPWEAVIKSDNFIRQSKAIGWLFGKKSSERLLDVHSALENLLSHTCKMGIYSLSQTYLDELLWAHYAFSHKGFCIEYDLDILLNTFKSEKVFHFPIVYNNTPPEITLRDVAINRDGIISKMAGFKSKRWEYEKEYRLVTNVSGKYSYNHESVKAIYFGLRMEKSHKEMVFERLRGRNIKYYQINLLEKSYKLEAVPVQSPYHSEQTYLKQIPDIFNTGTIVNYIIKEQNFFWLNSKGQITIELQTKVSKHELEWLANICKKQIFHTAKRIFIFYYLKNQKQNDVAWATSHIVDGNIDIKINDFVLLDVD